MTFVSKPCQMGRVKAHLNLAAAVLSGVAGMVAFAYALGFWFLALAWGSAGYAWRFVIAAAVCAACRFLMFGALRRSEPDAASGQ